jgi:NAD(P)H-hydrate epimerase
VIPVVNSEQMKSVDQAATEPAGVLIGRAGAAAASAAVRMLGGTYGRRVIVVAGKGNNGADGRAAAEILAGRGARVSVVDAASPSSNGCLPPADLVLDAAYGTGFRGSYVAPDHGAARVLAVDIPSGLPGDTGVPAGGRPVVADATVTFAAYKPGLLLGLGPDLSGRVQVADIGLGAGVGSIATSWLVSDEDADLLPARPREAHKWQTAIAVAAGSPGMMGAPLLLSRGAMRAGAGYVRLGVPGAPASSLPAGEAVGLPLPAAEWDGALLAAATRCKAIVMGPGLGRSGTVRAAVLQVLRSAPVPVVLDADGLTVLGSAGAVRNAIGERNAPTIITPHAGEYASLFGQPPGTDRLAAVRDAAAVTSAIVLLKGSTTVIAAPDGRALLSATGSPRLATAGTGDVLSGIIAAFLARGLPALEAAGLGAHVHGRAAGLGQKEGLIAGDLPDLVARWLSERRGTVQ